MELDNGLTLRAAEPHELGPIVGFGSTANYQTREMHAATGSSSSIWKSLI